MLAQGVQVATQRDPAVPEIYPNKKRAILIFDIALFCFRLPTQNGTLSTSSALCLVEFTIFGGFASPFLTFLHSDNNPK